jgi:hypothetical protein
VSGLQQRYKTFGEILTELRARLGFVAQGPSANNNRAVLKSFMQEAHDYLYQKLKPTPARKKTTITLEAGSYLYDWHNDIDDEDIAPGSCRAIWLILSGDQRIKLEQGITERHRSLTARSNPVRYDTLDGQIELWPVPDQPYDMIVEYIAPKPDFANDADRPGVPDRLIFLYALAQAKAHYRHPDAQAAGAAFERMLALENSDSHENRRYIINDDQSGEQTVQRAADGTFKFPVG